MPTVTFTMEGVETITVEAATAYIYPISGLNGDAVLRPRLNNTLDLAHTYGDAHAMIERAIDPERAKLQAEYDDTLQLVEEYARIKGTPSLLLSPDFLDRLGSMKKPGHGCLSECLINRLHDLQLSLAALDEPSPRLLELQGKLAVAERIIAKFDEVEGNRMGELMVDTSDSLRPIIPADIDPYHFLTSRDVAESDDIIDLTAVYKLREDLEAQIDAEERG